MDIRTAIMSRTPEKRFIVRERWLDDMKGTVFEPLVPKILPTDSADCCVITKLGARDGCRAWQPNTEDLVAVDWKPCK